MLQFTRDLLETLSEMDWSVDVEEDAYMFAEYLSRADVPDSFESFDLNDAKAFSTFLWDNGWEVEDDFYDDDDHAGKTVLYAIRHTIAKNARRNDLAPVIESLPPKHTIVQTPDGRKWIGVGAGQFVEIVGSPVPFKTLTGAIRPVED